MIYLAVSCETKANRWSQLYDFSARPIIIRVMLVASRQPPPKWKANEGKKNGSTREEDDDKIQQILLFFFFKLHTHSSARVEPNHAYAVNTRNWSIKLFYWRSCWRWWWRYGIVACQILSSVDLFYPFFFLFYISSFGWGLWHYYFDIVFIARN